MARRRHPVFLQGVPGSLPGHIGGLRLASIGRGPSAGYDSVGIGVVGGGGGGVVGGGVVGGGGGGVVAGGVVGGVAGLVVELPVAGVVGGAVVAVDVGGLVVLCGLGGDPAELRLDVVDVGSRGAVGVIEAAATHDTL
jgi:hypothetical protein